LNQTKPTKPTKQTKHLIIDGGWASRAEGVHAASGGFTLTRELLNDFKDPRLLAKESRNVAWLKDKDLQGL